MSALRTTAVVMMWWLVAPLGAGCNRTLVIGEPGSDVGGTCNPISTSPDEVNPCGRTFGLAFSSDGQLFASATDTPPPNIRLWRLSDGARLHDLPGLSETAYNVAFSPDSRLLAAAGSVGQGSTGTVKIYDVVTGREIRTLPTDSGSYSSAAVFSNDGAWLATAGSLGSIEIWRVSDWSRMTAIPYPASLHNLHFAPAGARLISGGVDRVATVWEVPSGSRVFSLSPIADEMADAEYSPDGTFIASTGPNNVVQIWDVATQAVVQTLPGHAAYVSQTAWVNQDLLLTDDWSGIVKTWTRATTGELVLGTTTQTDAQGLKMAVSPDRTRAAVEAGGGFKFLQF